MRLKFCLFGLLALILAWGCQSSPDAGNAGDATAQKGEIGAAAVTPDVGAVTPVTSSVSLDNAAGGGINSAAMKKAKKVAGEGVSSVNSDQKGGDSSEDGG